MPSVVSAVTVEFEFAPGAWTDVSSSVLWSAGISWARGIGEERTMQVGTCEFSLDNADGTWTPFNAASTMVNKLLKGVGVRVSTTHATVQRFHFTGKVIEITPRFYEFGPGENRVEVRCEGLTSFLRDYSRYGMATQQGATINAVLTAMVQAVGLDAAQYSFETSALTIPYAWERSDLLSDLTAAAASGLGGLLFEDGQGRLRFKDIASLTGYGGSAHLWGSTHGPVGEVAPDFRAQSVFARQTVELGLATASPAPEVLYEHPYNRDTGITEWVPGITKRRIFGTFAKVPLSVTKTFEAPAAVFVDSGTSLAAPMDAAAATLDTYAPSSHAVFAVNDKIRVDEEVMTVTAIATITNGQRLTVTRGVRAPHAVPPPPEKTIIYKETDTLGFVDTGADLAMDLDAGATPLLVFKAESFLFPVGTVIRIDSEQMLVTANNSWNATFDALTITRGYNGTTNANHWTQGVPIYKFGQDPAEARTTFVDSSFVASGRPVSVGPGALKGTGAYNGEDIYVAGRNFVAQIVASTAQGRYLSKLVIGGTVLTVAERATPVSYTFPIPGVVGIADGPSRAVPYGADLGAAKAYCLGALFGGRIPSPWLTVAMEVYGSAVAADILGAEIGDLVRYVGTGANREMIDEWYRIVGISGTIPELGDIVHTFRLAPAHLWRHPQRCAFTDFTSMISVGDQSQLRMELVPVGAPDADMWAVGGGFEIVGNEDAYTAGPTPPPAKWRPTGVGKNTGDRRLLASDQVINVHWGGLTGAVFGTATNDGCTVGFRRNVNTQDGWALTANPTRGRLTLTFGGVEQAFVPWTFANELEIEVRAQGARIRVYVDAKPAPIFDLEDSRGLTDIGVRVGITNNTSGTKAYATRIYAQGL